MFEGLAHASVVEGSSRVIHGHEVLDLTILSFGLEPFAVDLGYFFIWEKEIHCVAAECDYQKRIHFIDLFDEIGLAAGCDFFGEWITVIWWAGFYDICDENFCSVEAD